MQHKFWLFCVICVFGWYICRVVENMIQDQNVVIRFLGYFVAIIMAIGILWLVLYFFFNINLLKLAP